ncbi:MAG: isochorismatase family protein [Actinomycetota bacterium]|nr:isochorismatase family protein [Actinomycetota bacterium]
MITGEPDLPVTKSVNSCIHGEPPLQAWLDGQGVRQIRLCGITTSHSCETSARVGGNLGNDVRFVLGRQGSERRARCPYVMARSEWLSDRRRPNSEHRYPYGT